MTVFICSKFALLTTDAPCTISQCPLDEIIDYAVDSAHTDIQFLWPLLMGSGIHPLGHWPDFVYHIRSWFITIPENLLFFPLLLPIVHSFLMFFFNQYMALRKTPKSLLLTPYSICSGFISLLKRCFVTPSKEIVKVCLGIVSEAFGWYNRRDQ